MKSMYKNLNNSLSRVFGNKSDQSDRVRYSKRLREKHSRESDPNFSMTDERRAEDRVSRMEPTVRTSGSRNVPHEPIAHAGGDRDIENYSTMHAGAHRDVPNESTDRTDGSREVENYSTAHDGESRQIIRQPTTHGNSRVLVRDPTAHAGVSRNVPTEPTVHTDKSERAMSNPTVHVREDGDFVNNPTVRISDNRGVRSEPTSRIGERSSTSLYRGIQPLGSVQRSKPLRKQVENSFTPMDYTGTPMSSRDVSLEWDDTHREEHSFDPDVVHEGDLPVLEYEVEQLYANKPHLAESTTKELQGMYKHATDLDHALRTYRVNHPLLNNKVSKLIELMDNFLSSHPLFTRLANHGALSHHLALLGHHQATLQEVLVLCDKCSHQEGTNQHHALK